MLLLVGAVSLAARPTSVRAAGGPAEGSNAWLAAQIQLEEPASALAAGSRAARAGDPALAEWLFAETALRHPIIADYAVSMRAEQLLLLGRYREAGTLVEHALERWPQSPLTARLSVVLGEAYVGQGDEEAARRAWRRALDESTDEALRASLLEKTARSEERSGDPRAAATTWNVIWYLYPTEAEAAVATANLDRLEPIVGLRRDAASLRRRADRLFRKRRNEEALAAYDAALAAEPAESQQVRIRRQRAQTLFRMREYPRAVEAFGALPQTDDIPIWYARSLARAGRVPESIDAFEELATARRGQIALRARLLAALLLDGRDRFDEARQHLESLAQGRDRSGVREAALWRLAWAAYREGHHANAIHYLDQLIEATGHPIDRLRSRYWRARCLEALATADGRALPGALENAMREFEAMAREYPLSYYGWRASTRLPESRRLRASRDAERDAARSAPPPMGERKLASRELERARILLQAGLQQEALDTLGRVSRSARGLQDRLELAEQFRNAGSFSAAQRLVLDPYQVTLARGPRPTLEELWWHAWPAAFAELVRAATSTEGSVEPALVLSIMREESGFRPEVVSPVGARGLLQIMEPTGRRLAAAVGEPDFDADDLFEPLTNIRLGSHYLAELSARFDGRLSAAIASYNAGPEAVSSWLTDRPTIDDDEWVESIPYDQTRGYVKRVLRSLQAYRLLY